MGFFDDDKEMEWDLLKEFSEKHTGKESEEDFAVYIIDEPVEFGTVEKKNDWVLTEDQMTEEASILIDSYNILKDDYPENSEDIESIFVQLMGICPKKVIGFWHALIKQIYAKIKKGGGYDQDGINYSYTPLNRILYMMMDEEGFERIAPYLLQDDLILPTMYQYGDIDYSPEEFLAAILFHEEYEKAEQYLDLIAKNPLYDGSDKEKPLPLKEIMGYYSSVFQEEESDVNTWDSSPEEKRKVEILKRKYEAAKELFERYMSKETDAKNKAKLNVAFLKMKKEIDSDWPEFD